MSEAVAQDHHEHRHHPLKLKVSLPIALGIAIVAACLIVVVAYFMYLSDSNQKYDIARPGQNSENQALNVTDDDNDTTSPVDAPAVQRKLDFLTKELNALEGINKFNPDDLSDQNIQLLPGEPGL